MPNNGIRFFCDPLRDYDELKYIFEYGFKWDDKISLLLDGKTSQNYRKLENALSGYIYEGVPILDYDGKTVKEEKKNKSRKIIDKKTYSLEQRFWFQNLYGCYGMIDLYKSCDAITNNKEKAKMRYGMIDGDKSYDAIKCLMEIEKKGGYEFCKGNSDELKGKDKDKDIKCDYKRCCRVRAEIEAINNLKENGESEGYLKELQESLHKSYPDMIEEVEEGKKSVGKGGKLRLKENPWTREKMQAILLEERYENFLEWISFFSVFAPLSALGSNFLWKMREPVNNRFFFIRGLGREIGLEQESIYRCLCAIHHKKMIQYDDKKKYIPIRLIYSNNHMDAENVDLYLIAEGEDGIVHLPLKGHYIFVTKDRWKKNIQCDIDKKEEEVMEYTVEFYMNDKTQYLNNRINGIWEKWEKFGIDSKRNPIKSKKRYSPYYPGDELNKGYEYTYHIKKSDEDGFKRYIMSFGEFAKLKRAKEVEQSSPNEEIKENIYKNINTIKGQNPDEYSLCNIFSVKAILEVNKNIPEFQTFKNIVLPPSEAEVAWIDFIIQEYPNMSQTFLSKEELDQIHEKIQKLYGNVVEKWFDKQVWDWEQRVVDCMKRHIDRNKRFYKQIKEKNFLRYRLEEGEIRKEGSILLYAMEYNRAKHMEFPKGEPFQIMCYDWKEKRNCLIKSKSIKKTTDLMQEEEISCLDKLYHVLAYAVRSAFERGSEGESEGESKRENELPEKENAIIQCIWKTYHGQKNSNYERCICKKIGKLKKSYHELYEEMNQVLSNHPMESEIESFVQRVFFYWENNIENFEKDSFEIEYQTLLLYCFCSACEILKDPEESKKLLQYLENITLKDIFRFLLGEKNIEKSKEKLGEIAYYNKKLKWDRVSFTFSSQKYNEKSYIDCVYDIFKSYVCTGKIENSGDFRFTVTYEKFNYRDIHKNLMAIRDLIDINCIIPENTREIIQKRVLAMELN